MSFKSLSGSHNDLDPHRRPQKRCFGRVTAIMVSIQDSLSRFLSRRDLDGIRSKLDLALVGHLESGPRQALDHSHQ